MRGTGSTMSERARAVKCVADTERRNADKDVKTVQVTSVPSSYHPSNRMDPAHLVRCLVAAVAVACSGPRSPTAARDDPHIAAVENGLLPPVAIAGRAQARWSVHDRMTYYRVPGASIAVIDGG